VNAPLGFRRSALLLLALLALARPAGAQHVLLAEDGGQMYLVCSANGAKPRVQKDGKVVLIDPQGFALREVPEFAPVFVAIRNVNVRSTVASSGGGGGQVNNDFYFTADFKSDSLLTDVFVVLALDTQRGGKRLFLWEIGILEPGKTKTATIEAPMDSPIGAGDYSLRLFAGGAEVMQTLLSAGETDAGMSHMVAARIKDVHNAPPRFFFGPRPEYPPELKKANLRGQAVVSVRIGTNGSVFDPVVKSATDPAFGAAALQAVKFWYFLPRVKNDYPVETKADIPIVFSPPQPAGGGP
jgi:TonB family protein